MAASRTRNKPTDLANSTYWIEARRPIVCLAFVAPMLLFYECGVWILGTEAIRNGIDVYLRQFLSVVGFGQYLLLPLLTTSILLAWHHTTAQPWRMRGHTLVGMWCESLSLGLLLLIIARLQGTLFSFGAPDDALNLVGTAIHGRLIAYFGAGIYEELLFRLMLLPAAVAMARYCGASRRVSVWGAVIATSLIFSAAHYQIFTWNADADTFQWFSFTFRASAGIFFSVLFIYRGFGIAVGAHALYDIFVQLSTIA